MVQLERLTAAHLGAFHALELPTGQQDFTTFPLELLEAVQGNPDRVPAVITLDGSTSDTSAEMAS